ncbi:IucA/IucC family protein [Mangrovibacillus cuniculi]|uniref:IucA/IucC family siderophore biosynthesis protein n=1 Tax=Mangrovibacillus cuniculi TaxID=2593652 RepID=A0A7S8HEM2_9BACI|nr:IucA/IucC family protein [Mangrovibacillus cuniculi]QPC45636.1 IucA/IucC family siderophore biosynthesis protein [Mangrovibacillus cuniculi]
MKALQLKNQNMLKEEQEVYEFLQQKMPEYAPRYISLLSKGRKGILHKLASGILRENIDDSYLNAVTRKGTSETWGESHLPSYFFTWIKTMPLSHNGTYKIVERDGRYFVFQIEGEFAYQRVQTTGDILLVTEHGVSAIDTASQLLGEFYQNSASPENFEGFIVELDNGTANATLSYLYEEIWSHQVRVEGKERNVCNLWDYIREKQLEDPSFSTALFFEQLAVEGHHLHPGAKTKTGLRVDNVFRYSPEFHQTFSVRFVAVHRTLLRTTEEGGFLETVLPSVHAKGMRELQDRGFEASEYDILPVHPWQYKFALASIYEEEIRREQLLFLPNVTLKAKATSSFRTVYPLEKSAPGIKLAVNSQMTSTVRSISTNTALNTTSFSAMIDEIKKREPHLTSFVPINEIAGAAFPSGDNLKSRNLSVLLRESIEDKLEPGEIAIAGSSLYAKSPFSTKTIVQEMVDSYKKDVVGFFEDYVDKSLAGFLTLMVKYGVALEGHLQNSVPVMKDGEITRFFFRDWGGARIYKPRLENQGVSISFEENSVSITNSIRDMHDKLYYTVFQNHYGEVIRQLVLHYDVSELSLWQLVKQKCKEILSTLREEVCVEDDSTFIFQPIVQHKSLTTMRLKDGKGYEYNEVPNPLSWDGVSNE